MICRLFLILEVLFSSAMNFQTWWGVFDQGILILLIFTKFHNQVEQTQ